MPTQEELQRLHDERLASLERDLAEAKRIIEATARQVQLIRRMVGLPSHDGHGQL